MNQPTREDVRKAYYEAECDETRDTIKKLWPDAFSRVEPTKECCSYDVDVAVVDTFYGGWLITVGESGIINLNTSNYSFKVVDNELQVQKK